MKQDSKTGKKRRRESTAEGEPAKALRLAAAQKMVPELKSGSERWSQKIEQNTVRLEARGRQGLCRRFDNFSLYPYTAETLEGKMICSGIEHRWLLRPAPVSLPYQQHKSRGDRETAGGEPFPSWPEQYFVSRDYFGNKVYSQPAQGQNQVTLAQCSKLYFILKPATNVRDQMAGVFTLNMKLIQSCVCEALGSFIPGFVGVL